MELTAAIRALDTLKRRCKVALYSDSKYLRDGITKWLPDWKSRGWKTAERKPVKNQDLWEQLDVLAAAHEVEWHWVRGHDGHPENSRRCWRPRIDECANCTFASCARSYSTPKDRLEPRRPSRIDRWHLAGTASGGRTGPLPAA